MYSALTHQGRESLFHNKMLTFVLAGHFSVQMVDHIWMQINTKDQDDGGFNR